MSLNTFFKKITAEEALGSTVCVYIYIYKRKQSYISTLVKRKSQVVHQYELHHQTNINH